MKKLIPFLLVLVFAVSCKDECSDEFCPEGYTCVDGVCEAPVSNSKFAGDYDTDYTGTGGLANSNGNTIASVATVAGTPNKIRIDVDLALEGNVLGNAVPLDLTVSIEGETDGDTYSIPQTTIQTEVEVGGFPFPVELTFSVTGTKVSDSQLNSTLTMSGLLSGTVEMVGTK